MRRLLDSRGHIMYSALAVAVLAALVVFYALGHRAEAVLGGTGNVTDTNNPHNLAYGSSGIAAASASDTRVCVFCHTPHSAITSDSGPSLLGAPLWNHELTNTSSVSYTVKTPYSSVYNGALSNTLGLLSTPPNQPDGASRLCLSCHDGTVSVGDVRSGFITMASNSCLDSNGKMISGSGCDAFVGTDLTTKHVVSVPMNGALITNSGSQCVSSGGSATVQLTYPWNSASSASDNVLLRPTTTQYGGPGIDGGSISSPPAPAGKYKAGYNYGVQCSTCHDPHYWQADAGITNQADAEGEFFVVAAFNDLCIACHEDCPPP